MSAGDYDFIENDCQTPLRERAVVNSVMNILSMPASAGASNATCDELAATIEQVAKDWRLVADSGFDAAGSGPCNSAKGDLVAVDTPALQRMNVEELDSVVVGERAQIDSGSKMYCVTAD